MGWLEDVGNNIGDAFENIGSAIGDFFNDPLGSIEDIINGTLDIITLGHWSYAKDEFRDFVAGLIPEQTFQDRERTIRSSTEPKTVIYGRVKTGGQIVYIEDDGKDNIVLWMCVVLAGHRVHEIEAVYANDELVAVSNGPGVDGPMSMTNSSQFGNNIIAWAIHGGRFSAYIPTVNVTSSDSSYNGSFSPPNWTSAHRLSYQSYVWLNLVFDKESFGDAGLPSFTFTVKGKNDLFDPRNSTYGYSDNQAVVMMDILRWDKMFGELNQNIDVPAFANAANIADEFITSGPGTSEKRYTVNGTFKMQAVPLEILKSVASAGACTPYFDVSSGKWGVAPGVYSAPVLSLDESDLIGGLPFQIGPPKNRRHNVAKGTYIDANQNFEAVGFNEIYIADYVSQDLEVLENSYDFAWTNSGTMARRLAKIDIERNRFGISLSIVAKFKAIVLTPGDRIALTVERLGWNPKIFRVEGVEISFQSGVALELREDSPDIYDWQEGDALALETPPAISIPGGLTITAPTGITFTEESYLSVGGDVKAQLNVSWNDQPSALAYDLQYKMLGDPNWTEAASFWQDNNFPIRDVTDGTYIVQVRAISRIGRRSAWTPAVYVATGFAASPVQSLSLIEIPNTPKNPDTIYSTILVDVSAPTDPKYDFAVIRYQRAGDPNWQMGGPVDDNGEYRIIVPADGATYTVGAASVSLLGIRSSFWSTGTITITNSLNAEVPGIGDHIKVPNVTGLELFGQGNDTEFLGKHAKFVWRRTTASEWAGFGSEGYLGASSSNLDQFFKDYQVEVWANNELIRTEFVVDPAYIYTYENNAQDFMRIYGVEEEAFREFQLRVYCRTRTNRISDRPAKLSVSNTPPKALEGLKVVPGFSVLQVTFLKPTDLDFAGVDIWVNQTQGFDPEAIEPTASTGTNGFTIDELIQGGTYYVRVRPYDAFGRTGTNMSSEFVVQLKTGIDLTGLSGWAYQIDPADRAFIENALAGDAIPSTKIQNLTAGKLTTGTLQATQTITSEGLIRAVDNANFPETQVGIGPTTFGSNTTYLMWAHHNGEVKFGVDELGNVQLKGAITIEAGSSGIQQFVDAGALAGLDAIDYDDLLGNKPPVDATAGADWESTLEGIPARFTDEATPGLNITEFYIGYFDGTSFQTYIQNDGQFHFGGETDHFIDFNGTALVIDSVQFRIDASGNAFFGGDLIAATGSFSGSIEASLIFGGTIIGVEIESTLITGGTINGATMNALTINGSVITGTTVRTAASGNRVELNQDAQAFKAFWPNQDGVVIDKMTIGNPVSTTAIVRGYLDSNSEYGVRFTRSFDGAGVSPTGIYCENTKVLVLGDRGYCFTANGEGGAAGYYATSPTWHFYAAGAGGAYGPFTGAHDALIPRSALVEPGKAVVRTSVARNENVSNFIPYVAESSLANQKNVHGIIVSCGELPETPPAGLTSHPDYESLRTDYCYAIVNGVGEGLVQVCSQGGDIEDGDFLATCTVEGELTLYTGSDMRVVVAKACEPVIWNNETGTSKLIACIYMCS